MNNLQKNLVSCCALVVFSLLALSSRVNKIHYGAFTYTNRVEDPNDQKDHLVLNDGTKIYGEKIIWKTGIFVKDQIKIDDQKFKIPEVRGYQTGGVYYARLRNDFIKRIVHGKINVYVQFSEVTTTSTDHSGFTHTSHYTRTDQFAQKGEDGPMIQIASQEDIKKWVSDCPLSVEMCEKSNRQMRKAIKQNRNYLNEIFEIYNNDCKPVERAHVK